MTAFEHAPAPSSSDQNQPTIRQSFSREAKKEHRLHLIAQGVDPFQDSLEKLVPKSQTIVSEKTGETREVELNPKFLAKGGEHLVFEFETPKHRDLVYKVNYSRGLESLHMGIAHPQFIENGRKYLQEDVKAYRNERMKLRRYFGYDAVPVQKMYVRDLPLSHDVIQELSPFLKEYTGPLPKIPGLMTVQRKLDLPADRTVSLNGYYAEQQFKERSTSPAYEKMYDAAHDVLLGVEGKRALTDMERQALALSMFPDMLPIKARIDSDPEFKTKLQDVVRRMVAYTNETGKMMDLAGTRNVVLIQTEKEWQLKMPDALMSDHIPTLEDLGAVGRELAKGATPRSNVNAAMNAMNTVRVINTMAILSGIPDRVSPRDTALAEPSQWRELFLKEIERHSH